MVRPFHEARQYVRTEKKSPAGAGLVPSCCGQSLAARRTARQPLKVLSSGFGKRDITAIARGAGFHFRLEHAQLCNDTL